MVECRRREQRDIDRRDLQAAVRHGRREDASRFVRGRLRQRWKYTFANVVYITDATSTEEVTSWVEPVCVDPELKEISSPHGARPDGEGARESFVIR